MGKFLSGFGLVILIVGLIIANTIFFAVKETEHVIVLQFGDPVAVYSTSGLRAKLPWLETVHIDKRNLEFDIEKPLEIIAADEERLIIDAFLRYKIVDPQIYYASFKASSSSAWNDLRAVGNRRLEAVLESAIRRSMGEARINEIITSRRNELMQEIKAASAIEAAKFGVEIIDMRIKRADFPDQNAQKVYARMRSERQQQAQRIRAEGEEQARRIRAEADKEVTQILAEAEETSLKTRGEADRERNAVFNAAYNRDAEFFAFYRSMQSYEEALQKGDTTLILSPDSEFFRYFNDVRGN